MKWYFSLALLYASVLYLGIVIGKWLYSKEPVCPDTSCEDAMAFCAEKKAETWIKGEVCFVSGVEFLPVGK